MFMDRFCRFAAAAVFSFTATRAPQLCAQSPVATAASRMALTPGEAKASHALEAAKKMGAPELYAFLKPMPKGADLHMHLSGAVYAETFLAEAAEQGMCLDPVALSFDRPDPKAKAAACPPGHLLASEAIKQEPLYDKLIDSFSMRGFVPFAGFTSHDQFFTTFDRFGGIDKRFQGAWLDEIASRAAAQNEQYLEIMNTPSFNHVFSAMASVPWPADINYANHMQVLGKLRDDLLAHGLRDDVEVDARELAEAKSARARIEQCPQGENDRTQVADRDAQSSFQQAGCRVRIHFLYQVLRGFPPEQVFAQTLLGFELASVDADVVGINFVRAEDRRDAMAEYHTEMLMLDYLHSVYPKVHISLHAGELAPGMVPPDGLRFHIREAVELGHGERIGHGIDVLHEDRPSELLKEMAEKHIMTEINLTSNDVILGVKGTDHPLAAYRAAHVPVALSTDDEGVSRIDLTHEYVKGVVEQNLGYADLKQMARTSLEHSFMPGQSLWAAPDDFLHRTSACVSPILAESKPASACAALLAGSERAAAQWELERRFAAFEGAIH